MDYHAQMFSLSSTPLLLSFLFLLLYFESQAWIILMILLYYSWSFERAVNVGLLTGD